MCKWVIILSLFFGCNLIYSQSQKTGQIDLFYDHLENYCKEKALVTDFCKAIDFYHSHQRDSCYVYAGKALEITQNQEQRDIIHYIQGVSAINKNMYAKALQNINSISEHFKFSGLKDHKLGGISILEKQQS